MTEEETLELAKIVDDDEMLAKFGKIVSRN